MAGEARGIMSTTGGSILRTEQIKDYLGIGDDTLARYIDEGLPHMWTGLRPGHGHRLFHIALVDEWLTRRMVSLGQSAATRPTTRRRGRPSGGDGPIRTAEGYDGF
jgi:hypothetical protein